MLMARGQFKFLSVKKYLSIRKMSAFNKEVIVEGQASMLYDKSEAVFYNKVQVLNRDISIQIIKLFAEKREEEHRRRFEAKKARNSSVQYTDFRGIHILDALAATGLRSVRYLKEIPNVRHVTINDLVPAATQTALENVIRNGVDESRVTINNGDACLLMYQHRDAMLQYDVIDLDPYGTAAPFLDSAVQAVADGGLLCVTCTDAAVLCGTYPEKCAALYGSVPLKARYLHEMALRILLHSIDSTANKYKRYIVPWMSVSVDFYVRVFVRVYVSAAEVKNSCLKRAYVYQSTRCPSFYLQPLASKSPKNTYSSSIIAAPSTCPETGGNMRIGGPIWSDPIHSPEVVNELLQRMLFLNETTDNETAGDATATEVSEKDSNLGSRKVETTKLDDGKVAINNKATIQNVVVPTLRRLIGLLATISEELVDVPLYYTLPELGSTVHMPTPNMLDFMSALMNAGYRVSQAHHEPNAIKTDAPPQVVWDIIRSHCKIHPPAGSKHRKIAPEQDAAISILQKDCTTAVDFAMHSDLRRRLVDRPIAARFPMNPEANWGPKQRAGRKKDFEVDETNTELEVGKNEDDKLEESKLKKPRT